MEIQDVRQSQYDHSMVGCSTTSDTVTAATDALHIIKYSFHCRSETCVAKCLNSAKYPDRTKRMDRITALYQVATKYLVCYNNISNIIDHLWYVVCIVVDDYCGQSNLFGLLLNVLTHVAVFASSMYIRHLLWTKCVFPEHDYHVKTTSPLATEGG